MPSWDVSQPPRLRQGASGSSAPSADTLVGVFWRVLPATVPGMFGVGAGVCAYLRAQCQDTRAAPCKAPLGGSASHARGSSLRFAVASEAAFGLVWFSGRFNCLVCCTSSPSQMIPT